MDNKNLRSYGLSLILLALAVGSLGRTLHVADSIKMAMSGMSLLFSLCAIALFVKAAPPHRRPFLVAVILASILALAGITFLVLR